MQTPKKIQYFSMVAAGLFILIASVQGYRNIGLPPVIIVGGSGVIGFIMWYKTYLKNPIDSRIILPLFLLTVAGLEIHMCEEYLTGFGPAMSRLFNITWTEKSFLMIFAFIGPILYTFTALGLYYKIPIAGFMAWFIFIGPGVAEFVHFIFPILKPAILPEINATISQNVKGVYVAGMRNYWNKASNTFYFSGMYTAILPMIPGIYAIRTMLRFRKSGVESSRSINVTHRNRH